MQQIITDLSQLDPTKQYTYADYLTWWFDERVELIRGYIRQMSPGASKKHQEIIGELHLQMAYFLKRKPCKVYLPPFDVRLQRKLKDEEVRTVVQPDICVVCDLSILEDKGCNGPPDMIVEVLSLSNSKHDLVTKHKLYEEAGVKEYWVVYPYEKVLDVYLLEGGLYILAGKYTDEDKVEVHTLPGLVIDLEEVFE